MYPILFQIGPIKLYTYGLMMAIAFLVAIQWAAARAPKYGVTKEFVNNVAMVLVIAGVFGGRFAYMLVEQSLEELFSFKFFEVWNGGMVFYGGFLCATFAAWWYSKKNNISFLTLADIMAPTIALAHFFGRLGCVSAGCCYGKPTELPWGIVFNNPLAITPMKGVPLHPTQIYEAIGNLIVVGLLLLIERRNPARGRIFASYLFLYAILRSTVEIFRGDLERGFFDFWGMYPNEWLSTSTLISILIIASSIFLFYKTRTVKR